MSDMHAVQTLLDAAKALGVELLWQTAPAFDCHVIITRRSTETFDLRGLNPISQLEDIERARNGFAQIESALFLLGENSNYSEGTPKFEQLCKVKDVVSRAKHYIGAN